MSMDKSCCISLCTKIVRKMVLQIPDLVVQQEHVDQASKGPSDSVGALFTNYYLKLIVN